MVWARQASQAAARGCKSCPEVKLSLSLPAASTGVCVCVCVFAAQGVKFLHGLRQSIFLTAQKGNFQAATWRDLGEEAAFLTNSRAKKRKEGKGGSGAGVYLSSGYSG